MRREGDTKERGEEKTARRAVWSHLSVTVSDDIRHNMSKPIKLHLAAVSLNILICVSDYVSGLIDR